MNLNAVCNELWVFPWVINSVVCVCHLWFRLLIISSSRSLSEFAIFLAHVLPALPTDSAPPGFSSEPWLQTVRIVHYLGCQETAMVDLLNQSISTLFDLNYHLSELIRSVHSLPNCLRSVSLETAWENTCPTDILRKHSERKKKNPCNRSNRMGQESSKGKGKRATQDETWIKLTASAWCRRGALEEKLHLGVYQNARGGSWASSDCITGL